MTNSTAATIPVGPILALDLGQKRVGAAVSDELLITIKRLAPLTRSNWKQLLRDVASLIELYDAKTLVIGLPLRLDGSIGDSAANAQDAARKFSLSLTVPVFLQDERLTSSAAEDDLRAEGHGPLEIGKLVDGEAAAIILRDFLESGINSPVRVSPESQ
jgi:putative holliday junction resolvase